MKRISLIAIALGAAIQIGAAVRTAQDALRIADEFLSNSASGPSVKRSVSASGPSGAAGLAVVAESDLYLAVNTHNGYVLVGADERLPEVLGYSDSGAFEPDNLPPAFRFWMQCYEEEMAAQTTSNNIKRVASNLQTTAVEPLVTSKWNQSAPYNNYAPAYNDEGSKCVTGCVATAMAQIMYFYKKPAKGTGSHSYLWICTEPVGKSATLSANFGQTNYDWANMIDSYKSGYTDAQANAVATLMYHCGVSVDMGFGQSSGAFTNKVPEALNTYFGYDANYQRIQKIMYSADSLNAIVHAELAANRPVLVSGANDEGGHAFVCDGCDNKGYFHINWGWGGSNDGYFLLTALNPRGAQGIGGTTQGYNKGTSFFIGLQPAKTGTPKAIPQMATTNISVSTTSVSRGTNFTVSILQMQNYGLTNFKGSYGIALYDEDETQLVRVLKQVDNYSLSAGYYRLTAADLTVSIPAVSVVPNGTYHLCAVYKNDTYGWMRMMCTEDDYFRTLTLTNTQATFYPNDAEPELTLAKAIAFPAGTDPNAVPKTGIPVSFEVKNTGGTFRGQISARIRKGNFSKGQYEIMDSVVIRRNQSLNSALQQKFDENLLLNTDYKMKLCWRAGESDSWHDFDGELAFRLYDPDYHLSLPNPVHFEDNDSVVRDNARFYYEIKNTGAPFDGELQLSFYQNNFSRGKSDVWPVYIDTNETLSDVFSDALEQQPGVYTVILRYREKGGEWQDFLDIYGNTIGTVTAKIVEPPIPSGWENSEQEHPAEQEKRILIMQIGTYKLYKTIK